MSHAHALAQLRHLYAQMLKGHVEPQAEAAKRLLGPAIEELETANDAALASAREEGRRDVLSALRKACPFTGPCGRCRICEAADIVARLPLFAAPAPAPEEVPSTEDYCTCGHRRGEHNRLLTGACGARCGPHAICDCTRFRAMAPRPWLAIAPAPEECGVATVSGTCWMPEGHTGEHDDRPLYRPAPGAELEAELPPAAPCAPHAPAYVDDLAAGRVAPLPPTKPAQLGLFGTAL